jgi:hypothetical protein
MEQAARANGNDNYKKIADSSRALAYYSTIEDRGLCRREKSHTLASGI